MSDMRFNMPIIEPEKVEEIKPKFKIKKLHILFALIILIILILAGVSMSFYLKAKKLESQTGVATVSDIQKTVAEAGKLIVLPEGEEPTVATVSNVEKLKGQPFFANAKNGDKVLIYTKAQKAILYDPIKNIIVEVMPLNMNKAN